MLRAFTFSVLFFLTACSSAPSLDGRIWLDSSTHSEKPPEWTVGNNEVWEKNGKVFVRAGETVAGDERVDNCFELAQIGSQGELLVYLATELRKSLDSVGLHLNVNAEAFLRKVHGGEFTGRMPGLRHTDKYFERYRVSELERVDCRVLGEMSRENFDKLKSNVFNRLQKMDHHLREIVLRGQFEPAARKD